MIAIKFISAKDNDEECIMLEIMINDKADEIIEKTFLITSF